MAMGSSIQEWLRNTHADLEVYSAQFEELGYNLQFLMETESEELEQDLKSMVKKVHLRVILKAHAKLKTQKPPEDLPAATAAAPGGAQKSAELVEPSVFQLIPCARDVMSFQSDTQSIHSGQVVLIPIWCLRSIQGGVHSQMTFTSGKHKEASVYELIHDMLSGRQRPQDVEPLQVVVDEHGLHIVRGHRRGLALCALQGMWRDRTVLAPCRLYSPKDPEVAGQFLLKDTVVDGLALQLHGASGKHPEAWHRGKPLFRTAQEWCDSLPEVPVSDTTSCTDGHQDRLKKSGLSSSSKSEACSSNCAHFHSPAEPDLFEAAVQSNESLDRIDPSWKEWNKFQERKRQKEGLEKEAVQDAFTTSKCKTSPATGSRETSVQLKNAPEICVSMLVCVHSGGNILCGEVLDISLSYAKLRYTAWPHEDAWVSMDRLQIPDYSSLQAGMEISVWWGKRTYPCRVLEVSQSKDRLRAPVKVRYSSGSEDEWIGMDRMQPGQVKLFPFKDEPETKQLPVAVSKEHVHFSGESPVVCCMWLMGRCTKKDRHHGTGRERKKLFLHKDLPGLPCSLGKDCGSDHYRARTASVTGHVELQKGMVVCLKDPCSSSRMCGEILAISPVSTRDLAPVQVRYTTRGQAGRCQVEWFGLQHLLVPNFSRIVQGSHVTVDSIGGDFFKCTVLQVSEEKGRKRTPLLVNYKGFDSSYDEWVGVDRVHSNLLVFHRPTLPSDASKLSQVLEQTHSEAASRQELPCSVASVAADVVPQAATPEASTRALPWNELETETNAFEIALRATEDALVQRAEVEQWQPELERTLSAVETEGLRGLLQKHSWSGQQFTRSPHLEELLEDLNGVPAPHEEDTNSDSDVDSKRSILSSNDLESSCAAAPSDLEDLMARQPNIHSLEQLAGLVVFGTFRSMSGKDVPKRSGEVIVHRGPEVLRGCKVKIWCGKNRGPTWDYDRCYVRILDAHVLGSSRQNEGALNMERTELFGRIVQAVECGVPRQKLFVCVKPKVVHNLKCVGFKPINGKLPAIQVPWNRATALPNSHDLHVVKVLEWNGDRCPKGHYLEALKMSTRQSDMSILEAVQISLNFCDWQRDAPRSDLAVDFQQPARRSIEDSGVTVAIQHPGLPIAMAMSCSENELHVHVLDVNAYLDSAGMEKVEELVRRRSVGVWFLDHLDNPFDASLPLFPPNIQEELTFKAGLERPAVTFTIEAAQLKVSAVRETSVRCNWILNPAEAGAMILSDEGGDAGRLLRRINSYVTQLRRADIVRGSGSALEYPLVEKADLPGPLVATEQLLQGCKCMVDRHVGATLTAAAWKQILKDPQEDLELRHLHGRADPSMRKVIERLLRFPQSDRNKKIQTTDVMRTLGEILEQPGLTRAQKHACRSSFLRRLQAALPGAYYEVTDDSSESRDDWWHPELQFQATSPLQRYIDILGMRALKCHLGWTASCPHMLLSRADLEEAVARTNCRMAAESFGMHIFRTISRMRELSRSGQQISNAVIGAVGPTYINILVPSETPHTLELKVPVSSLCSSTCVSEYDAATQSVKLTMLRDRMETLRIHSWCAQRMTCVISRNYAQPIPHHASPNSIVVWEIRFHGDKDFVFPTGLKSFPECFSSWPDLTDWPMLDRKLETYSQVWSRIRSCQVHAAALVNDAYTPAGAVSHLRWFGTAGTAAGGASWNFECQVDVKLSEYQWLQQGDLAVLSLEDGGRFASLQGILTKIRSKRPTSEEGKKSFIVEVKLSRIAELAWNGQEAFLENGSNWRLHFILIPPNEKKSVQLLQDMQRFSPLQGMGLTIPRSSKDMKRDMEMRPLVTIEEVKSAMLSVCSSTKLNEKQTLAVQRGLQRPFSMVQGPPGTGKTSFLVHFVAALLSASRQLKKGQGRILVCAPSNHAADHILDRLLGDGISPQYVTRIYSRFIERAYGSMYKGGTTRSERSFDIQPHLEEHSLHWKVSSKVQSTSQRQDAFDKSYEDSELQVLRESRIVITTCAMAYLHTALVRGEPPHVVRPVSFDSIVIDEAAQASEPDIVLPATSASSRVIVVGDHKQLGPVVTENNLCFPYISALETPFLERIYQNPRRSSASTMLNMQYRMHPSIRSFPSSQFYESMLEDQVLIPHRPQLDCIWPQKKEHRSFIDCRTPQSMGLSPELTRTCDAALMESKVSLKNVGEAKAVVAACAALLRQNCAARDIAVITPYKAQQLEIRARLERDRDIGSKTSSIVVGTVHALQGSEREYIIVSFVRSTSENEDVVTSIAKTAGDSMALEEMYGESLGILKNYRVLNVAITRAKYGLICVGNADMLSKGSKDFRAFIHSLRSCRCIVTQEEFLESVRAWRPH